LVPVGIGRAAAVVFERARGVEHQLGSFRSETEEVDEAARAKRLEHAKLALRDDEKLAARGGVERGLDGGGVVRDAIADCAEIAQLIQS